MRSAHYNFYLQKWTYLLLLDKQGIVLCALIQEVSFFSRYRHKANFQAGFTRIKFKIFLLLD